jgi:hypothetical protein
MKIGTVTPTIYGEKQSSNHTYQVICPACMIFGVWDLNIMLFNISEFQKKWCKKSHTLLMSINEITFTDLP